MRRIPAPDVQTLRYTSLDQSYRLMRPLHIAIVLLVVTLLGSSCGSDGPPFADVQFDSRTCDGIAREFGLELDRRSLALLAEGDPEREPDKTVERMENIRLGLVNSAARLIAETEQRVCDASTFLDVAEQSLSASFRDQVPFWLTGDPINPENQPDYDFWRNLLLELLAHTVAGNPASVGWAPSTPS